MRNKFLHLFLSLMLIFTSSAPVFANDIYNSETSSVSENLVLESDQELLPDVTNYSDSKQSRIPNAIPMTVKANQDGTGCTVHVGNIGVDGLDLVAVTVKATGYSSSKTQKSYVFPITGKTFSFDFPMIKSSTTYSVTVKITDGGNSITKTGSAKLEYSESRLSGVWNKGSSYSSRGHSLENHFARHGDEVNSSNIVNYINKAVNYRSEVLNSLKNIRTSPGTGSIPSTKYKHLIDGRFILLTNSNKEILSFGR